MSSKKEQNRNIEMENYRFGTIDYIVFLGVTVISTGTGIYIGALKKPKETLKKVNISEPQNLLDSSGKRNVSPCKIDEFLMGSRNMTVVPVALSLIGSSLSGVTIIGTPPEIYHYGTQYFFIILAIFLQGFAVSYVFLPVYWALKISSAYEYLEMRFHRSVRSILSFIYVLSTITYLPFLIYLPALALNQVSGINAHLIELVMIFSCVMYTFVGGLKAVVHTDVWQVVVMFLSMMTIAVVSTYYSSGLGAIFEDAQNGGRLIWDNTSPSLYTRHTVWSVIIGSFSFWTSINAVGQHMVQRYMSLPSLKKSREASWLYTIGVCIFVALCCFSGLLIYSKYKDCDPLSAGMIMKDDQLLPLFVVQSMGHIYGIPGLFIAGIFGAGLSSLSSCFNTLAMVFLEDIVRGFFKMHPSERVSTILIKSSIIFQGIIAFLLVFLLQSLSGILSVCNSISSITAGSAFGIFTLGMLVPWANTTGTVVGGIFSFLLTAWISFGSQFAAVSGQLKSQMFPVSLEGCMGNMTSPQELYVDEDQVFPLYRLSYHWVNPIGVVTTLVVGSLVSLITKPTDIKTLRSELISPVIHRFLPKECFADLSDKNNTQQNLL